MRVPDYFEPITAYRAWTVRSNGLLCGRHQAAPWAPREAHRAACRIATDAHITAEGTWVPAPVVGCTCGVYALLTLKAAKAEADTSWQADVTVYGTVKLWGRVLEHERGYRAEYAYPASLITSDAAMVPKLAQLYGVPVTHEAPAKPAEYDDDVDASRYTPVGLMHVQRTTFNFWRNQPPLSAQPFQNLKALMMGSWPPVQPAATTNVPMTFKGAPAYFDPRFAPSTPVYLGIDWAQTSWDKLTPDPARLIWQPDDTSPIETPDKARDERHTRLWKKIAHPSKP